MEPMIRLLDRLKTVLKVIPLEIERKGLQLTYFYTEVLFTVIFDKNALKYQTYIEKKIKNYILNEMMNEKLGFFYANIQNTMLK